jgi:hypothetical protein
MGPVIHFAAMLKLLGGNFIFSCQCPFNCHHADQTLFAIQLYATRCITVCVHVAWEV